jgi:hypothetical protein
MMAKHRFDAKRWVLVILFLVGTLGCSSGPSVIPEMKDVIDNFTDRAKRETVLNKYGSPGVVPQELTLCDMAKPVISKTEVKEGVTYYTLESRVEKCEHSPAAVGTVRIFAVGWKNGKIAKFVWGGPKGGKVEY